jgi:hypothetical protein
MAHLFKKQAVFYFLKRTLRLKVAEGAKEPFVQSLQKKTSEKYKI